MKKKIEEPIKISPPAEEDEMELLNIKHYEKQMDMVRYILNLKRRGLDLGNTTTKSQLAPSYVEMVWEKGEDEMDCYWRKLHRVKKEYRGKKDES